MPFFIAATSTCCCMMTNGLRSRWSRCIASYSAMRFAASRSFTAAWARAVKSSSFQLLRQLKVRFFCASVLSVLMLNVSALLCGSM